MTLADVMMFYFAQYARAVLTGATEEEEDA